MSVTLKSSAAAGKMGAYLSEPITKKEITEEEDDKFWVSSMSMQGWRTNQEVRILKIEITKKIEIFAVQLMWNIFPVIY